MKKTPCYIITSLLIFMCVIATQGCKGAFATDDAGNENVQRGERILLNKIQNSVGNIVLTLENFINAGIDEVDEDSLKHALFVLNSVGRENLKNISAIKSSLKRADELTFIDEQFRKCVIVNGTLNNWVYVLEYTELKCRASQLNGEGNVNISFSVSSVEEISLFTNLTKLDLSGNNLGSIDLSNNLRLEELNLSKLPIKSLDLTSNENLKKLYLTGSHLINIEIASHERLIELKIASTAVTQLNVENNVNLEILDIADTTISTIDLGFNAKLKNLNLSATNIEDIDLSKLDNLRQLNLKNTPLNNLEISSNVLLQSLNILETNISFLNVINNTHLSELQYDEEKVILLGKSFTQLP